VKRLNRIIALFFLFLFPCGLTYAQETEKIPELSRFNLKATIAIPTILSNKALRSSFRGVYDAGLNYQTRVLNGIYLGVHGNYTGFKIAVDKFNTLGTELQTATGGLNIGYEKFSSPRITWFVNLAAGYNWMNFSKVQCPDSISPITKYQAWNFRPSAGFTYYADENFSLGMLASYTLFSNQFNPRAICLDEYGTFKQSESVGNTSYFSIGVVLNFNLRKGLFIGSTESDGEEED
jgi:hypothetical protein